MGTWYILKATHKRERDTIHVIIGVFEFSTSCKYIQNVRKYISYAGTHSTPFRKAPHRVAEIVRRNIMQITGHLYEVMLYISKKHCAESFKIQTEFPRVRSFPSD